MAPQSAIYRAPRVIAHDCRDRLFVDSRFDVNPNTGEPLVANRRWKGVDNTVYHGPGHPSALTLWRVPVPWLARRLRNPAPARALT